MSVGSRVVEAVSPFQLPLPLPLPKCGLLIKMLSAPPYLLEGVAYQLLVGP